MSETAFDKFAAGLKVPGKPALRCLRCGEQPRHGRWTLCRKCMGPIWRQASRKAAASKKKMVRR